MVILLIAYWASNMASMLFAVCNSRFIIPLVNILVLSSMPTGLMSQRPSLSLLMIPLLFNFSSFRRVVSLGMLHIVDISLVLIGVMEIGVSIL